MRRLSLIITLLCCSFLLPATANAVTLQTTAGSSSHWQSVANASKVPTLSSTVTITDSICPWKGFESAWACTISDPNLHIYMNPTIPKAERATTLWHELGHAFADTYFTDADKAVFGAIIHSNASWDEGEDSPNEKFATAYSIAARYGDTGFQSLYPQTAAPKKPHSNNKRKQARYRHALAVWKENQRSARTFRTRGIGFEHGYRATPAVNSAVIALINTVTNR